MQQNTPQIDIFIITHIAYNKKTGKPVEGPYTSVANAIHKIYGKPPAILEIPLNGFEGAIVYGEFNNSKSINLPKILGLVIIVKYFTDLTMSFFYGLLFIIRAKDRAVIIGIDPLSTLSLTLLRKFLSFKLVYYCVDFSKNRTANKIMQSMYEYADRVCSKNCDQVWVVCEALRVYKKEEYGTESTYVPNSFPFDPSYYEINKEKRSGNKVVWTGSILTDRQIEHIFRLFREIQVIRPEMEFCFVPSNRHKDFEEGINKHNLRNARVYNVIGQQASREIVSKCDLGVAIYDINHGSTKFIEPIKIWEYMMCGLPFIISQEPSLNIDAINSGVAYRLGKDNEIPKDGSLRQFVNPSNLKGMGSRCVELAQKYDVVKIIKLSLNTIYESAFLN